jgi:[ribosomal protein S18]-alanine N-acetyltransferase
MSVVRKDDICTNVCVRWMMRRDIPALFYISDDVCQTYEQFAAEIVHDLRNRDNIGMVAECGNEIVGYMIYQLQRNRLSLFEIQVAKEYRRMQIGGAMIRKLQMKLHPERRREITALVHERNYSAQCFYRKYGFVGRLDKGCFTDGDGILFRYTVR